MMRRALLSLITASVIVLPACGNSTTGGSVRATHAWARDSAPGQTEASVYLRIANGTDHRVRIQTVTVPRSVAASASLHQTTTNGDAMAGMTGMRDMDRLTIGAHHQLALRPGRDHLMISGLAHPLHVGDRFPITIRSDRGPSIRTTVVVRRS